MSMWYKACPDKEKQTITTTFKTIYSATPWAQTWFYSPLSVTARHNRGDVLDEIIHIADIMRPQSMAGNSWDAQNSTEGRLYHRRTASSQCYQGCEQPVNWTCVSSTECHLNLIIIIKTAKNWTTQLCLLFIQHRIPLFQWLFIYKTDKIDLRYSS